MKHILLGEDDVFLGKMYVKKFENAGFKADHRKNGEEILEFLKSSIPDVIVLDLIMPRMDGFKTLEILKADPIYKNIPVYILSVLGEDSEKIIIEQIGGEKFYTKSSVILSDFINIIKEKV